PLDDLLEGRKAPGTPQALPPALDRFSLSRHARFEDPLLLKLAIRALHCSTGKRYIWGLKRPFGARSDSPSISPWRLPVNQVSEPLPHRRTRTISTLRCRSPLRRDPCFPRAGTEKSRSLSGSLQLRG